MQKKLCRPVPLEMIGSLTVATLRELAAEAGSKGGRSAAAAVSEEESAPEAAAPAEETATPKEDVVSASAAEAAAKKVRSQFQTVAGASLTGVMLVINGLLGCLYLY